MSGSRRSWTQDAARMASVVALASVAIGCQSTAALSEGASRRATNCFDDKFEVPPNLASEGGASRDIRACQDWVGNQTSPRRVAQLVTAQYNLGRMYAEVRDYSKAVFYLDAALRNDSSRDRVRLSLARALRGAAVEESSLGRREVASLSYQRSLDLLQEVIDNQVGKKESLAPVASFERGRVFEARGAAGDRDIALREFRAALPYEKAAEAMEPLAIRLGNEAFESPSAPNRENTQRAVRMFIEATVANKFSRKAYIPLGDAYMRLAGLDGRRGVVEYKCEAGIGSVPTLESALDAYSSAVANMATPAEAQVKQACALQALGRNAEATRLLRSAVDGVRNDSSKYFDYRIRLAQSIMLEGKELQDRERKQDADAHYKRAIDIFGDVLKDAGDDDSKKAEVHVELARAYSNIGDDAEAKRNAEQAISKNTPSAVPHLIAGVLRYRLIVAELAKQASEADKIERDNRGVDSKSFEPTFRAFIAAQIGRQGSDYEKAVGYFKTAAALANPTEAGRAKDIPTFAEALYYLSLLEDMKRWPDLNVSVVNANRANELGNRETRYQERACLARIKSSVAEVFNDITRGLCAGGEDRTDANAMLLEGTYFLRRAHGYPTRLDSRAAWENAFKAFDDGVRALETTQDPDVRDVRERLLVGRGLAHFCIGFENLGARAIYGEQGETVSPARAAARGWYVQYDVYSCRAEIRRPRIR